MQLGIDSLRKNFSWKPIAEIWHFLEYRDPRSDHIVVFLRDDGMQFKGAKEQRSNGRRRRPPKEQRSSNAAGGGRQRSKEIAAAGGERSKEQQPSPAPKEQRKWCQRRSKEQPPSRFKKAKASHRNINERSHPKPEPLTISRGIHSCY